MDEKEYIELERLISDLKDLPEQERIEYMGIYDCIKSQPIADVEEVRHGKWVFISGDLNYVDCKCSECDYIDTFVNDTDFFNNYCPNCGAKMDKE
ncbi:MAG: hypothetical protein ACI4HO_02225 [Ruminococcus sp.]